MYLPETASRGLEEVFGLREIDHELGGGADGLVAPSGLDAGLAAYEPSWRPHLPQREKRCYDEGEGAI